MRYANAKLEGTIASNCLRALQTVPDSTDNENEDLDTLEIWTYGDLNTRRVGHTLSDKISHSDRMF